MTMEDKIKAELSDHIVTESGQQTPAVVPTTTQDTPIGSQDEVPESILGDVILRVVKNTQGQVVAWETMKPSDLADQIKKIDDPGDDLTESDSFSKGYLTSWRDEGRDI